MPELDSDTVVKSDGDVLELHVVTRNTGGRPLFLTARRFVLICKLVERGATTTAACRQALVSYAGFRNHVTRQPLYAKRLKKAEVIRDQVWRSDALDAIHKAFEKNWVSAMTYMERKYPNEFSNRNVFRPDDQADKAVGNNVPLETLVADARIAAEVAAQRPVGLQAGAQPEALKESNS